jgi:hypothetical protein
LILDIEKALRDATCSPSFSLLFSQKAWVKQYMSFCPVRKPHEKMVMVGDWLDMSLIDVDAKSGRSISAVTALELLQWI